MDAPVHIKITDIDVRDRLREVDASKVEALKQSFAELGMRTPITVRVGEGVLPFALSAGAHRLEAARQLGWLEVPGFIRDESKLDSELWEIDENLARSELSAADRAVFTFRRKELYLIKYPETQHGGDRKSSRQLGAPQLCRCNGGTDRQNRAVYPARRRTRREDLRRGTSHAAGDASR
jgi:hypothetical protein